MLYDSCSERSRHLDGGKQTAGNRGQKRGPASIQLVFVYQLAAKKTKKMEEIMTMIENKLLWKSISTLAKNVPKNRSFFTPNANS